MKTLIKSAIIGLALAGVAQATPSSSYVTQNASWNLTGSNQNFTFTKFDSSLGTLSAIQLILDSATVSGSVDITNNTVSTINIDALRSRIALSSGTGFSGFDTTNTPLPSSPSTTGSLSGYALGGSSSQTFTLTPTSLLGLASTTSITAGSWADYTGSGNTPNFTARIFSTVSSDAGDPSVDLTNSFSFSAPSTSVTLRYTYTPSGDPSAVPEPGQVAASLLLLGGIGGYIFIKRRRKPAVVAA